MIREKWHVEHTAKKLGVLYTSHLSGVVRRAMGALEAGEMVRNLTRLSTILAIDITHGVQKSDRHWLHANRSIQQGKMILHVFHGLATQWAGVPITTVLVKATQMHHVTALDTAEWFRGLEQRFVANGAVALQLLGDAAVFLVVQGDASVAAHTVTIVNAQAQSETACIAIGAVKNRTRTIVVQVANATKIARERLVRRGTIGVDATVTRWLQGGTNHAKHFRHGVAIQRLVFAHGQLSLMVTTQPASIQFSRLGVTQFTGTRVVRASKDGPGHPVVVGRCQLTGRKGRDRSIGR